MRLLTTATSFVLLVSKKEEASSEIYKNKSIAIVLVAFNFPINVPLLIHPQKIP
jgi:hypothetical protein